MYICMYLLDYDISLSSLSLSQVEEAKYRPYFLDDTDEKQGGTTMPSQQSRRASQSSVTPEKRSVAYSEEEL